ncbi:MAG: beta-galactosidase [Polyangiaceae bacterium]
MKHGWSIVFGLATSALALFPGRAEAAQGLGLNVHQSADVGVPVTADAGLTWVRVDFNWLDAEPSQGVYDFTRFDTIVDSANARGLKVLATVGYGPAWASAGDTLGDGTLNDVPIDGAYAAFVTALVSHFQGRVDHYELWNEPNLDVFFEGSVDDYVDRVLLPGAAAVHAACPDCLVVAPGIASIGGEYDVWLDTILTLASDDIDIISAHVYAGFPDMGAGGVSGDDFFNKLDSHRVFEVNGTVLYEGPLSFKEVMNAHGAKQPFWMTETGIEADPSDPEALAKQATYTRHVLEAMLPRLWWTATIFYEAFDEPASGYTFGVTVHDGSSPNGYSTKPAFEVIKKARATQPRFGGTPGDCVDGLDEDGDNLIDYPADPDCESVADIAEGILSGGAVGAGGGGGTGGLGGGGGAGGADTTDSGDGCGCALSAASPGAPTLLLLALFGFGVRRRSRRIRARAS